MAYNSFNKLWENEFDNIVSKQDKVQDMNINQLKLEVHDIYKKDLKNNRFYTCQRQSCYKQCLSRRKNIHNRWSFIVLRRRLQRIEIRL